jgi:hypothetical protein
MCAAQPRPSRRRAPHLRQDNGPALPAEQLVLLHHDHNLARECLHLGLPSIGRRRQVTSSKTSKVDLSTGLAVSLEQF